MSGNNESAGGGIGRLIDVVAALLAIGAGVYLLSHNSIDSSVGTSWFQVIGHGIGIYFIGKGLFMMRSAYLSGRSVDHLKYLAEWVAYDHRHELARVEAEELAAQAVPVD